jgi:hypothetical protein
MNISVHAKGRCRQRGITEDQIELILKYGTIQKKDGAYECFIPRKQFDFIRSNIKHALQALDKISRANKAIIVDEGTIIKAYNKL